MCVIKDEAAERAVLYVVLGLLAIPITGSFVPLLAFIIVLMATHWMTAGL